MAKKGGATHLIRQHEQLKQYCKELEIQNTSFGLCLSALVLKHGDPVWDEETVVGDQYIFRLEDFKSAENTRLTIETLSDVEGEVGTIVKVIKPKQEVAVTNGEAQEESGT